MINLIIAATQRCGSTMILEDLRNANVFGLPEEYFIPWYNSEKIINVQRELEHINRKSRGANNFSSVKIMADQLKYIERKLSGSKLTPPGQNGSQFMPSVAELFRKSYWVYVKRDDVLRQAISRHMSIETKINHATQNDTDSHFAGNLLKGYTASYNESARYDFQKIKRHCVNIVMENIIWANFFKLNEICPLTLTYEQLCFDTTFAYLDRIADFIGIDFKVDSVSFPQRQMVRLSNRKNDNWYFKFLADINGK